MTRSEDDDGFLSALIGDGSSLLILTGMVLVLSGVFALFLSLTGSFLPHDIDFLGMQPNALCAINECKIVHFMLHDRVSFGGTVMATGALYIWLAFYPLRRGEAWAWWTFVVSGSAGFASFLCYLGYGYLDTWHGWATAALLPCFLYGMFLTRRLVGGANLLQALRHPGQPVSWATRAGWGRLGLLGTSVGMVAAGLVIMTVGMTSVFVPQDLAFIGLDVERMREINPRLIPLIAHDRAGFGGCLASCGLLIGLIVWKARMALHLWQALLFAGLTGFGSAIGVHYPIGYTDVIHLAPAWLGAIAYAVGMWLSFPKRAAAVVNH